MPGFNKLIPALRQLFPASGLEVPQPREVTDLVHLTHDLWTPRFAHDVRLRSNILTAVGAGVGINLTHVEPDAGYFQVVAGWSVWHDSAAGTQVVAFEYFTTANELDPWGRWDNLNRGLGSVLIPAAPAGAFRTRTTPIWFPIPRGLRLNAAFAAVPVGANVRSHLWWVDVPGELLRVEMFAQRQTFLTD